MTNRGLQLASNARIRREYVLRIEDETVLAKTGRTWAEWRSVLDVWEAPGKPFIPTARHLRNEYELSTWWANTIAARYRWERGLGE